MEIKECENSVSTSLVHAVLFILNLCVAALFTHNHKCRNIKNKSSNGKKGRV